MRSGNEDVINKLKMLSLVVVAHYNNSSGFPLKSTKLFFTITLIKLLIPWVTLINFSFLLSELGLWYQLERTDKEGRIPFHWLNSFIQHKKFLSLRIRPDRPPPIQVRVMHLPLCTTFYISLRNLDLYL